MRRVGAFLSTMIHLTMLQMTTERAVPHITYSNLNNFSNGESGGNINHIATDESFMYRGTTMLPRYFQLGNQTVDLNKLFKVPQDTSGGNDKNHFANGHRRIPLYGVEVGPKRDEDFSNSNVDIYSEGGGRIQLGSDIMELERSSETATVGHHIKSKNGHTGHSVHPGQMPWLRTQFDHDRRHGPHFEDPPKDNTSIMIQAGHNAHLDCRVSYLRDKTVSWLKRKSGEAPQLLTVGAHTYTSDPRFSVQFRYPGNWRLQVNSVNKTDEGVYECQLSTHPPTVLRVYLSVNAPEVQIVDESGTPLREKYYEAGSTLSLRCVARAGGPGVLWLHGARALHRDTERGGVSVRTEAVGQRGAESTLRLSKLGPGDAGNYTCALEQPMHSYTVLVHVLNESLAELQQGSSMCKPPTYLGLLAAAVIAIGAIS